ncbi:beta-ketoacyl-[acyl-carrier-protein] synthase family protein [Nocardia cyriacigeorgica]|uniref:beta-ketoacyl-[acyl-carrier-protein] synthase family protein n=1 Tax=Nocardia cyriacigeorgica TaxID=135487 RepID=UPI000314FF05|nr:beta-ketoacyl-[acyl-carrier-protein] synthase family protein [Nocardia cyriacigeorgica]TLF54983.1 beta-ketoacyl-[acyl-carrier-protein] synthase family protein [Nocardia cyriacigeorgica]
MTEQRRVVVTGIGLLTAIGGDAATTWDALLAGHSGIRTITAYDPAPLRTRLGAEIDGFEPERFAARKALRMLNRGDQLGLAGATLALADAGIDPTDGLGHRCGLFLGGNKEISRLDDLIGSVTRIRRDDGTPDMRVLGEQGASIMAPLFFVEGLQPAAVFHVSQKFGIRGPNAFYAGTADSGATAIGRAMRAIRRGEADLALAGGYDDATNWWPMSKMDGVGVLSTANERGAAAFRPFDRERSGSILGEGAAILVLEERAAAQARGARIYAEIAGFGAGNECHPPPAPHPSGRGLARAIDRSLADAAINRDQVCYVAAHGCATGSGDLSETRALHTAFGEHAPAVPVSSVKPQTGHLVGGAGAVNAAVAALAVHHGVIPGTAHLDDPDPGCDLDYVPDGPREAPVTAALALARGFEGQAVSLALTEAR